MAQGALIIYSTEDVAGTNIAGQIRQSAPCSDNEPIVHEGSPLRNWNLQLERSGARATLLEISTRLANASDWLAQLPIVAQAPIIFFASRHRSETAMPCLSVHSTGNWNEPYQGEGGQARSLGRTSARAIACCLSFLCAHPVDGFQATLEATHHGPTVLAKPCVFVEVGSSQAQWAMEEPCRCVAQCILHACTHWNDANGRIAIGFGGTHYCAKFNSLAAEGKFCTSFIAPKHALDSLDAQMVRQAVERTLEKADCALLDWKGTNLPQREKIIAICKEMGLPIERV